MGREEARMENNGTNKLAWFVGGTLAGIGVALLVAPASGAETRRRIANKTANSREALSGSGQDMIDRGRELYERGRQLVDEAAEMFERGRKLMEEAPKPESQE
jgi:gas vesicle protein